MSWPRERAVDLPSRLEMTFDTPETSRAFDFQLLFTPKQVAVLFCISEKTIHKLVREGKLACVQVTARDRRFTQEQIQEYIRSKSTEARVDKRDPRPVQSPPKKGGEKSFGHSGVDLRKEMKKWR